MLNKYVSYLQLILINTHVITHYHLDWGSHTDDNKQPHHDLELWQVAMWSRDSGLSRQQLRAWSPDTGLANKAPAPDTTLKPELKRNIA